MILPRRHEDNDAGKAHMQDEVKPTKRGGPVLLEDLKLTVISHTDDYLVLNKAFDTRLDGEFEATIEHKLHEMFPDVEKFRWIHQLDFATSGVMCVALNKSFASMACQSFQQKTVAKEYLAVVHGHMPFIPTEHSSSMQWCRLSEAESIIEKDRKIALREQNTKNKTKQSMYGRLHAPSKAKKRPSDHPKGPRSGSCFYAMHLSSSQNKRPRPDTGVAVPSRKWKELSKEEKLPFLSQAAKDTERYERQMKTYYPQVDEPTQDEKEFQHMISSSTGVSQTKEIEPMGYIFSEKIAESPGNDFRMEIESSENPGKRSTTIAFVLAHGFYEQKPITKVLLRPLSGRRHQLRLHLSHHNHPIVGDATYATDFKDIHTSRMMLHAYRLRMNLSNQQVLEFEAPDSFGPEIQMNDQVHLSTF